MKSNYKNGSVVTTPGGKFRAFFTHNGKRTSKTFTTKQAALDWLAVNRSDVALGEFVEPTDITFGQWLLECLRYAKQHLKPSSINAYKVFCRKLEPLANIRLQKLNAIQIQRAIDAEPSIPRRFNLYKFFRSVIRRAVKLQLIRKDIMLQIDAPKYRATEKAVFNKDELQRIYKVLEIHKYKAFFTLAFASGCRLGELAGLKIQNVYDDHIRIDNNITQGKDSTPKTLTSIRDITLPPNIIRMLRKEWERSGMVLGGYVFSNRNQAPYSPLFVNYTWRRILQAANVPYRNFHYTRHTHATQLLSNGVPILEVQHRLGHANASTTLNKYGHILIDNKDKVLNAVDNLLGDMVI